MSPAVLGFITGLGLILAIGAQNAFVIRQGLMRRHVFWVTTVCAVCDAVLIALGVAGLGALIAQSAWLTGIARWGGAAFLIWFGLRALWNAVRMDHKGLEAAEAEAGDARNSVKGIVLATLGFSLLNPHVYLDTVVLLGGIGAQFPDWPERLQFMAGAAAASVVFFYSLGYGAMLFSPLFRKPIATRILDGFVAAVMFAIAAMLVFGGLG